jgi:hypothetical protein
MKKTIKVRSIGPTWGQVSEIALNDLRHGRTAFAIELIELMTEYVQRLGKFANDDGNIEIVTKDEGNERG